VKVRVSLILTLNLNAAQFLTFPSYPSFNESPSSRNFKKHSRKQIFIRMHYSVYIMENL